MKNKNKWMEMSFFDLNSIFAVDIDNSHFGLDTG